MTERSEKATRYPVPKEQDRATGDSGDLGVWPDDVGLNPAPVWDGLPAVFAYVTHVHLLERLDEGDEFVLIGSDRAISCTIDDIDVEEEDDE